MWKVRLTGAAKSDFKRILGYTVKTFGNSQASTYQVTLLEALAALEQGPMAPGSISRENFFPRARVLHVARNGRRGRHFIVYRESKNAVIEVIRILHDAMDLARHLPPTT